jgi:probable sporulation protein (polysaccharide deacetylase family)
MHVHYFFFPWKPWIPKVMVLLLVLFLAGFGIFSTLGVKQLVQVYAPQPDPIFQGNPHKAQMSITCNVAWGAEFLPDMLDTLQEYDVKATFFMEGRWVEQFPELTRRLFNEGHELGNHSYSHPYPTKISQEKLRSEILETEAILENLTGVKPTLFAPPYGDWNRDVVKTAADLGYKTIMWTVDTIDWERPGIEVIISRVLENSVSGGIILLHPTEQTVDALPQIIAGLKEQGFALVTVTELLAE